MFSSTSSSSDTKRPKYQYQPIVDTTSPVLSPTDQYTSNDAGVIPMNFGENNTSTVESLGRAYESCMDGIGYVWDVLKSSLSMEDVELPSYLHKRSLIIEFLGVLFGVAWWLFIDGVVYAKFKHLPVEVKVEDWVPGLAATIGFIMMNIIDKDLLLASDWTHAGSGVEWRAKLWFFLSLVFKAGALGGAISILVVKYTQTGHGQGDDVYVAAVMMVQTLLIILVSVALFAVRNSEDDPLAL